MRAARAVPVLALAVLLAACDGPPAPQPSPMPSVRADACSAQVDPGSDFRYTRTEAPTGARYWVAYGIVTNDCDGPLELDDVITAGAPANYARTTGRSGVIDAPDDPTAYWTQADAPAMDPLRGYQVVPGRAAQVIVEVEQIAGSKPHPVPPVTLGYRTPGGTARQAQLWPVVSLCSCTRVPG